MDLSPYQNQEQTGYRAILISIQRYMTHSTYRTLSSNSTL
ncbi:hypothetical protein TERTU_0719 [Teredinibacter turnerae T7901]|uniref:Uncharacterized protein n=1 Tax=Teredinibacter turnerae (strain ATCC 39867 / T7901) TaxID=377629 RepID=C5BNY4_TERTT|nr:hypothetical protein TERTU_0719 [Teredinibacter turnerae T7901]